VDSRPIHETEVRHHLKDFGIDGDLATSKIKGFSGGQKSRVVLAAAMWNRPHLIALDEPTNYLDKETLRALVRALKAFKGAVLTISHNTQFVTDVCNEKWELSGGRATMLPREDKEKATAGATPEGDEDDDGADDA
jgi:ATPase subunit of ABC transporter with duplicated ATPase domains